MRLGPVTKLANLSLLKKLGGRASDLREALGFCAEVFKGLRFMRAAGPCVAVIGASSFHSKSQSEYALARAIGVQLARKGYTVVTGGGPGLMEAANRGAKEGGGLSIGCCITATLGQKPNRYLDRCMEFQYPSIRKFIITKHAKACIVLPGGFGTLEEMFGVASSLQSGKEVDFPLILVGSAYWEDLIRFLNGAVSLSGAISSKDLSRIWITDSPADALEKVRFDQRH